MAREKVTKLDSMMSTFYSSKERGMGVLETRQGKTLSWRNVSVVLVSEIAFPQVLTLSRLLNLVMYISGRKERYSNKNTSRQSLG